MPFKSNIMSLKVQKRKQLGLHDIHIYPSPWSKTREIKPEGVSDLHCNTEMYMYLGII